MTNTSPATGHGQTAHADILSLEQARELFPANTAKGHVSTSTIFRWIVHGKRKKRLKGYRIKGKWFTTAEDVTAFRRAFTAFLLGMGAYVRLLVEF